MPATNPPPNAALGSNTENLALLYQAVLTAVVRLQTGRMRLDDPHAFRKMTENLYDAIRKEAGARFYSAQDIDDADCATAALLDETVRKFLDPGQGWWAPLRPGGESLFDRLNAIWGRGESAYLADVLEVYYLCILLGYEGPYAGRPGDLEPWKEQLRVQIESRRGAQPALSPTGRLDWNQDLSNPASPPVPAPPAAPRTSATWKITGALCLALAGVSWIVLKVLVNQEWHGIAPELIRP